MKTTIQTIQVLFLLYGSFDLYAQRVGLEMRDGRQIDVKISATSNSTLYTSSGNFEFVDIGKAHFQTEEPNSKLYDQMKAKGVEVDFLYQPAQGAEHFKQVINEPFTGANTILIDVGQENRLQSHLKWANHLLEAGYEIQAHDDILLTLSTSLERVGRTSVYYSIKSFLNQEGKIRIRVYIFMDISVSLAPNGLGDDWEYGNQTKSAYGITYQDFIEVIRSFGYPIEFKKSKR